MRNEQHVGWRYLEWDYYDAPKLSGQERARVLETFAVEFRSLSPALEPWEGWGETMAYLCRRIAARLRGESIGEWIPRWKRVAPVTKLQETRNAAQLCAS